MFKEELLFFVESKDIHWHNKPCSKFSALNQILTKLQTFHIKL